MVKNLKALTFFSFFVGFFLLIHTPASAATTSELLPTANGTYQQWSTHGGATHYTDVDESVCNGNTDYVNETTLNQRESEKIDLSSVPDGSTITGISITPCASRNSNGGNDPTASVFYVLNGVVSANSSSYSLSGTTPVSLTQSIFSGLSILKQSTTAAEIGMVYTSGNKGVRLSRIAATVTYDPLSIPQNLSATAASYSAVNLSWSDSTSETGYKIERSPDGTTNWSQIGTTGANVTTYADSGLNAVTTYYYRIYAYNSVANSGYSTVASVTTPGTAPSVTTDSSQNITASTADLYSTVNPHGDYTMAGFRYGKVNTACNLLTGQTGYVSVTTGHTGVQNAMRAMSLDANTLYYYCAEAYNSYGTSYGIVMTFTTLVSLPTVSTDSSSNLASTSARIYASVNPKGSTTTLAFRYGTSSTSCDSLPLVTATQSVGSDNSLYIGKYQDLNLLQPATTYYYCAVATNAQGSVYGNVNTFTTTSSQPFVVTTAPTDLSSTSAVLTSSVNPNGGATMVSYRYQQTNLNLSCNSLGSVTSWMDIGSGNTSVSPNNQLLDTLTPNTTYKFCAVAYNNGGTVYGNVQSFTTTAVVPTVTTSPDYRVISSSSAMLQGGENPNNSPTVMRFRYGTTAGSCASLPQTTPDIDFGTSVVMNHIEVVSGLTAATTYYYCASATNAVGTAYGDVYSFTTLP